MTARFAGSRLRSSSGFTIVELVVVIVIAVIMATVALPRFFGVSSYAIATSKAELISLARFAQESALNTTNSVDASGIEIRHRVQLVIDHAAGEMRVEEGPAPAAGCVNRDANRTDANVRVLRTSPMTEKIIYPLDPLGVIQFDALAAEDAAAPYNCTSTPLAFDLDQDGTDDLCMESSGYLHPGACYL